MSNNSRPGIILAVIENEGIIISTKTDPIILLEAKLEGKNISSKKQLIQQLKPTVGENLSDQVLDSFLENPQIKAKRIKK